jgi:hypothetical protein
VRKKPGVAIELLPSNCLVGNKEGLGRVEIWYELYRGSLGLYAEPGKPQVVRGGGSRDLKA